MIDHEKLGKFLEFVIKLFTFIALFSFYLVTHETIHYEIYSVYHCTDVQVHLTYTSAFCPNEDANLANMIQQIVGNGAVPFLIGILYIMILNYYDRRYFNDRIS